MTRTELPRRVAAPSTPPPPWMAQASAEALMAAHVEGAEGAFEALHRKVAPRLRRFLRRLSRNVELTEDLLQITFAKAHVARDRYKLGSPVLAWLQTIARRSYYDEARYARNVHERLTGDGVLPETSTRESEVALRVEAAEAITNALRLLEDKQREAILLTVFEGLSMSEAAAEVGASRETVKTRVHRGRLALKAAGEPATT